MPSACLGTVVWNALHVDACFCIDGIYLCHLVCRWHLSIGSDQTRTFIVLLHARCTSAVIQGYPFRICTISLVNAKNAPVLIMNQTTIIISMEQESASLTVWLAEIRCEIPAETPI